ncbi:ComF family protein [Amycolatopsis sp. MtRt-6]|uniref:ComF family protein n=1 Tax=Amycolatopsis sp. MtRt-6 TaxID=2792782 RepID=UPI001A8C388F|nr:phosphoribosyltransferase [Amycolatopsis sp. MtRt-6]
MSHASGTERYRPDKRASRLEAWKLEESETCWYLWYRSSSETTQHIIGALPRAKAVRTLHHDPEWPYRIRLDFAPSDALTDFLRILENVLVIEREYQFSLDAAVALDFYSRQDAAGDVQYTDIGRLLRRIKGYEAVTRDDAESAGRQVIDLMEGVVSDHAWLSTATRIIPVPGHSVTEVATSVRIGAALAGSFGIPLTQVTTRSRDRKPAKHMPPSERKDLLDEFRIEESLAHRTVLVVDDVYHTGRTMAGVARAAKRAGADVVLGLAGARNFRR